MACLAYIGRPETYPIGSYVTDGAFCYVAVRDAGNGWVTPSNDWFWTVTDCTQAGCVQVLSSSSELALSSSSMVSSIGTDTTLVQALQILHSDTGNFLEALYLFVGFLFGFLALRQIRL